MRIVVMSGSHRQHSASGQVAAEIVARLQTIEGVDAAEMIDLAHSPLPFWNEGLWQGDPGLRDAWRPYSERLRDCEALVAVTPEWHGMVPAALKNLFLYVSDELAHKPALAVGVSATEGGAYPILELRSSSYKNARICWVPDHVIVRRCRRDSVSPALEAVSERLDYALSLLIAYAQALRMVRGSGLIDMKRWPFGM